MYKFSRDINFIVFVVNLSSTKFASPENLYAYNVAIECCDHDDDDDDVVIMMIVMMMMMLIMMIMIMMMLCDCID